MLSSGASGHSKSVSEPVTDQFAVDVSLENETIHLSKTEKAEVQPDSDMFEGDENKERESSLFKEDSVSVPQISQIQPKMLMVESTESQVESGLSNTPFQVNPETSPMDVKHEISEGLNSQVNSSVDGKFARCMVGITFLLLAGLAAATALSFAKQTKALKSDSEMPPSPLLRSEKSVRMELVRTEGSSQDCSAETDMDTESWKSGTSSTHRISTKKGAEEVQSQPKKTSKRESFASSDCSMSSYGSFTTHEILHKKIRGDEETIVTPVRRSSRIRKQVTSP